MSVATSSEWRVEISYLTVVRTTMRLLKVHITMCALQKQVTVLSKHLLGGSSPPPKFPVLPPPQFVLFAPHCKHFLHILSTFFKKFRLLRSRLCNYVVPWTFVPMRCICTSWWLFPIRTLIFLLPNDEFADCPDCYYFTAMMTLKVRMPESRSNTMSRWSR